MYLFNFFVLFNKTIKVHQIHQPMNINDGHSLIKYLYL